MSKFDIDARYGYWMKRTSSNGDILWFLWLKDLTMELGWELGIELRFCHFLMSYFKEN
jgi:hypothetical protein